MFTRKKSILRVTIIYGRNLIAKTLGNVDALTYSSYHSSILKTILAKDRLLQ